MRRLQSFALMLSLCCGVANAVPVDPAQLPAVLRDWRAWVLQDREFRNCPFLANQAPAEADTYVCAWPGQLALDASENGVNFSLQWRVDAPSWIVLPGDAAQWPQSVTVNQQRQPVLLHDDAPSLFVTAGSYAVTGNIPWHERPQALRVPLRIGLVTLRVDGKIVVPLQREGDSVTLGRSETAAPEADSMQVRVFRKLQDDLPATLTTQIMLSVSGLSREEVLGPVLPRGFAATAVKGDWPARLDSDGQLHVQVQPGAAVVTVDARALAPLASFVARLPQSQWPKQEIVSYAANPHLRITSANAALAVDPQQADVPPQWRALPAFALANNDQLTIQQRSRGLAPDAVNRLSLQREAWLDFAGDGWYARDTLRGDMVQGWRFDVSVPLSLERAQANAASARSGLVEPLLVTSGTQPGRSGVEWRTPKVDLTASVQIAAVGTLPAGGWQQTFDKVDTTLHFPFGYRLLAAPGSDSVDGSWMSGWSLLDVFLVSIVALLAWRLLGLIGGIAATLYMAAAYQEPGSPLWTLLAVLAFALVTRALPCGALQRTANWLRRCALLLLVVCALPFLADQVRYAIYPQLEESHFAYSRSGTPAADVSYAAKPHLAKRLGGDALDARSDAVLAESPEPVAMSSPPPAPAAPPPELAKFKRGVIMPRLQTAREEIVASVAGPAMSQQAQQIDHYSQSTVVQTGAGEPHWDFGSTARLQWSGPVLATQDVRLIIAPPWLVRCVRVLIVLLLAWLGWRIFRNATPPDRPIRNGAAATGILLLGGLVVSAVVQAQGVPSDALLQQLRERLTQAPACVPACANIAQVQVSSSGDALTIVLEVHAGERIALPLPQVDSAAMLKSVKIDEKTDAPVMRSDDSIAWIAVDRGVHRVEIIYIANAEKVSFNFGLVPGRVLVEGNAWSASGLEEDHLLTATLVLTRVRSAGTHGTADQGPGGRTQQFAPYVKVVRSLNLGLDWTMHTAALRLAPATGGFTLDLPLASGEHVSTSGIKVHNDAGGNALATVSLADGSGQTSWDSTLEHRDTLILTAPPLEDRAEVWRVVVSPTWHVEFAGVPGVGIAPGEDARDYRNFEFHPLPGETLTLAVTRPTAVDGAVRAIDSVFMSSDVGQHTTLTTLRFSLRAAQGGEQMIGLPADVDVIAVKRDNEILSLRALDGKLSLPVKPGTQAFEVQFRDHAELGARSLTPLVTLGLPAANIDLALDIPADRWLLAATGPTVGPAILYWGELIVVIALAAALARTGRTRLKFRDWLLLGLGFSTFSWIAFGVVVAWLFAFDWRGRKVEGNSWWRFDVLQIALGLLTVAALCCLVAAIPQGLLGQPDMHVVGNGSQAQALRWFADRSNAALPQASAYSVPLWIYKVLMLAWALWLANALIGWLRDGFTAWMRGGYWRLRPARAPTVSAAPAAVASPTPQP